MKVHKERRFTVVRRTVKKDGVNEVLFRNELGKVTMTIFFFILPMSLIIAHWSGE